MKTKLRRGLLGLGVLAVIAVLALAGPPAGFLAGVWWRDGREPLPVAPAGRGDASRMIAVVPAERIAVAPEAETARRQLAELVARAAREGQKISIGGARHSMGGHTLYPGGLALDMLPFRQMSLAPGRRLLTVGAGARWSEVIPYLDARGLAVAVMQANNDFSVGGSLSVNGHGWQHASPPIASTVEAFRLLTAEGTVVRCSRTENPELFSLALGGYGLFGVILDADLRVVPNELYRAKSIRVRPAEYAWRYRQLTSRDDTGMAYGRISVAPDSFLREAVIVVLERQPQDRPLKNTLTPEEPSPLKRLVFRGTVGSDYGKNLRWRLERTFGETGGVTLSRNQVMDEPAGWFSNRDPAATEILHEYFVPQARLAEFLVRSRPVLLEHRPDLLNITVREVRRDDDTFLRYAREDVFGLVLLFHQGRTAAAEAAMRELTRELIEVALASGGTYYLPYRPHATREQLHRAYPMAEEFFARKRRYDPQGMFGSLFAKNYGG